MILNLPNALTALRALGVPLFLYLFLVQEMLIASFIVITLGGITDYLDGKVARALNQTSEFGAKFDPVVDRLYIAAIIIAFAYKDFLPWELVIAIMARDLILALVAVYQKIKGWAFTQVVFLGKAATFNLLYAFPFLLLQDVTFIGNACFVLGWAFAIWGISLYFYTGVQYFIKGVQNPNRRR